MRRIDWSKVRGVYLELAGMVAVTVLVVVVVYAAYALWRCRTCGSDAECAYYCRVDGGGGCEPYTPSLSPIERVEP